jgi:hypothetical protein
MDFLHATYVKIVAAGGDLDAASENKLAKEVARINIAPAIVERMSSNSPAPNTRAEVGTLFESDFVMMAATLDHLVLALGGTHSSSVFTKTQGFRTLPKYDIRFGVVRASDGLIQTLDITDIQFVDPVELPFEHGQWTYLKLKAKGTDTSELVWDND